MQFVHALPIEGRGSEDLYVCEKDKVALSDRDHLLL